MVQFLVSSSSRIIIFCSSQIRCINQTRSLILMTEIHKILTPLWVAIFNDKGSSDITFSLNMINLIFNQCKSMSSIIFSKNLWCLKQLHHSDFLLQIA